MTVSENPDYLEINRDSWNKRTDFHLKSDFYDLPGFLAGQTSLQEIELGLLGDVQGKKILHLQCHFGQDTLSLARLGATVTGIDLSDRAIAAARQLAQQTGIPEARFVCGDVYDTPHLIPEQFDIVFTSYGVIGWLPDMDRWAKVINQMLKPGGRLVFVEFHPVVWMFDNNLEQVAYAYFKRDPIVETLEGTYADREAPLVTHDVSWNHSLHEVIGNLLRQGLVLESFDEYDYSPYNCLHNMVEVEKGRFRVQHQQDFLPLVYSLTARKQG